MEVISEGKIEFLMKEDENVLAYRRYTDSQEMLVMCNLTSEEAPVTLPQGWENTDVLIANWDNATALTDLTGRQVLQSSCEEWPEGQEGPADVRSRSGRNQGCRSEYHYPCPGLQCR